MKKAAAEGLRKLSFPQKARASLQTTLGFNQPQSLASVAVEQIIPNQQQPRRHQSAGKFADLVLSIRERGILQPIRVRELSELGKYEIIAGERRWRAAQEVGLKEIPAIIVRDQAPEQAFIDSLVENVVREDLNPIDRAEALSKIKVHLGALATWDEVASSGILGISRRQIFHLLGLTTLPDAIKEDIRSNVLTEKHGRALRTLRANPALLQQTYEEIKRRKLSGDETLTLVNEVKKNSVLPAQKVLKIYYRTPTDLITALEEKLASLRHDVSGQQE